MPYPTAVLFDLDGTLTDPMEGITKSVQLALRRQGNRSNRPADALPLHRPAPVRILPEILWNGRRAGRPGSRGLPFLFRRNRHF